MKVQQPRTDDRRHLGRRHAKTSRWERRALWSDSSVSRCCETDVGVAEHFVMADPQSLDPPSRAAGERDEETQLDQFGLGEMPVQALPQFIVSDVGVPRDGSGVPQGDLLTFGVSIRIRELQQIVVVGFGEPIPSSLDGSLDASIVTCNRLRHIHPTEFFQLVIEHAFEKRGVPCLGERVQYRRDVAPDGLALGSRGCCGLVHTRRSLGRSGRDRSDRGS